MQLPDLRLCLATALEPFVQKGAAWLDEYDPGWAQKVNPDNLDLSSSSLCICGQLFGCYTKRPEVLDDAWKYGFDTPPGRACGTPPLTVFAPFTRECGCGDESCRTWNPGTPDLFPILDTLWLDEVYWRTSV